MRRGFFIEQNAILSHYINLHPHFLNNMGELKAEYSKEGLHLDDEYYQNWYHILRLFSVWTKTVKFIGKVSFRILIYRDEESDFHKNIGFTDFSLWPK